MNHSLKEGNSIRFI